MASCYECLHINVCKAYEPEDADCICNQFKNKADFVEVVRCKDCKKWTKEHTCKEFTADRSPLRGKITFVTEPNDFCSYGTRK